MNWQHCWRLGSGDTEGDVLFDVVPQHQACQFIGHLRQQPTSIFLDERAREHDAVEQDLDVDLVVGGVNSGGVVDRVGVDPAPVPSAPRWAYSILPSWLKPRLPPSPTTRART